MGLTVFGGESVGYSWKRRPVLGPGFSGELVWRTSCDDPLIRHKNQNLIWGLVFLSFDLTECISKMCTNLKEVELNEKDRTRKTISGSWVTSAKRVGLFQCISITPSVSHHDILCTLYEWKVLFDTSLLEQSKLILKPSNSTYLLVQL